MAGELKNIKFKFMRATVLSIEHVSRVLISWELEPTTQPLKNLRFFIYRGESPSEMKRLNSVGIRANDVQEYVDSTGNLIDLNKVYYYQVHAIEMSGNTELQSFTSEALTWDGDLDFVGLYVVEEHLFAHRYVYGVPAMIFKKRHDGLFCPDCWDRVLKRVTRSNCLTCFGTGKVGGFYPPIEVWMSFEPDPKQAQVTEWGLVQPNQTDIQFTNYPLLSVDDVIVELKPNKIWKVSNIRFPEKNRTVMLQIARISAVNPTDIEYKLEISEDRRKALVAELEARDLEREF